MNFEWTPEQEDLRRALRGLLEESATEADLRRVWPLATGDDALWKRLSAELGVAGIAIPETYGGAGCGFLDLVLVQEELGRALACSPFFSSVVLAATLLLESGDEAAQSRWLPGIANGETLATLAFDAGSAGDAASPAPTVSATRASDTWTLDGQRDFVIDGLSANVVFLAATTEQGLTLFSVETAQRGLERSALDAVDASRKLARIGFHAVRAEVVGQLGAAARVVERTLDLAAVALAAEQVGGARRVLEMAVDYAGVRHQFGKPIGSFQAVKHTCADMLLELEAAATATYYAAWAVDASPEEVPAMSALARATASEAYTRTAEANIQVHGGIGFTWDHPAHLHLRRARSAEILLGSAASQRHRFLSRLPAVGRSDT